MSKNFKVLRKKATHILHVRKDNRMVIAFDDQRNRVSLQQGGYQFFYAPNPCNLKIRALHLVNPQNGLYVSEHYLESLDREFWEITALNSRS